MTEEDKQNSETKSVPVNTRMIEEPPVEEEVAELSPFSPEVMKAQAEENRALMSAGTRKLLAAAEAEYDALKSKFRSVDMSDYDLKAMIMDGSYRNPEPTSKDDQYIREMGLPATILVKSISNPKNKLALSYTEAVALAHFLPKLIDSQPDLKSYSLALDREIAVRKANRNVLDLGKE